MELSDISQVDDEDAIAVAKALVKAAAPFVAKHLTTRASEDYPECLRCSALMELTADNEMTAFCSECAYVALDAMAWALEAVPQLLEGLERLMKERDDARDASRTFLAARERALGEKHAVLERLNDERGK